MISYSSSQLKKCMKCGNYKLSYEMNSNRMCKDCAKMVIKNMIGGNY